MPTLTIKLPRERFRRVQARARSEGFGDPTEWAKSLLERTIALRESPRMKPGKIIARMRKTGLYREAFLRELRKSLAYADPAA